MTNSLPETGFENKEQVVTVESDFESLEGAHPTIEVDKNAPGLFLFDIDGTLINAKAIHGPAVISLYKEVFSLDKLDEKEFANIFKQTWFNHWGPGDRLEHEMLCNSFNLDLGSEEQKKAIIDRLVEGYGRKMEDIMKASSEEDKAEMLLPGVREFLDETKKRKIPSAIVTGNVKQSAEALIKCLDLAKYFIAGGFDDDSGVRNEPMRRANILESAITKCEAKGINFPTNKMAVFGDTPKDFLATLHRNDGLCP